MSSSPETENGDNEMQERQRKERSEKIKFSGYKETRRESVSRRTHITNELHKSKCLSFDFPLGENEAAAAQQRGHIHAEASIFAYYSTFSSETKREFK